jgi:hypothetical protein
MITVNCFILENDFTPVISFAGTDNFVAIYRLLNSPPTYFIISAEERVNEFIMTREGAIELAKRDYSKLIIKHTDCFRCLWGNVKLRDHIEW